MSDIEYLQNQYMIITSINGLIHLIVLVACITLFNKKRTPGTILLLLGSILTFLLPFVNIACNIWVTQQDSQLVIKMQTILSYVGNLAYGIFGVGLLLFAINDLKKQR